MYNLIFVDDENGILEELREMALWEDLDIQVIGWCDNALSALELMINEHTDILITDIRMPVMNGLELISRAKEMYPMIECIVLSGHEEFELARGAIERGVRGYLLKPCTKEELERSIRHCVQIIGKRCAKASSQFEQRQEQIESLYHALINLPLGGEAPDEDMVYRIVVQNHDLGLLREAAIMVAVQHEQIIQNAHEVIRRLSRAQKSEELIRCIVDMLREIGKREDIMDPVVAKMVRYVYEHYDITSLTVQYVADQEIHLTSKYIGRRFLKEMNMRFSDFLMQVRMEKAKEFLNENDYMNTEELADRVGLGNNLQYFYRLFRQYTGMTVKEYRDKIAKNETKYNANLHKR